MDDELSGAIVIGPAMRIALSLAALLAAAAIVYAVIMQQVGSPF